MKILAILQNQWFKNPDKIREMYAKRPDKRHELNRLFLFYRCKTGKVLKSILGEDLCFDIVWEEASKEIGDISASKFKADPLHIKEQIETINPDVVICFGKIAQDGFKEYAKLIDSISFKVITMPHPVARRKEDIEKLKTLLQELTNGNRN